MSSTTVRLDHLPARLVEGKPATATTKATDWFVTFSVRDPRAVDGTGRLLPMRRFRIKVNRVRCVKERRRLGMRIAQDINTRLALGWSPFIEAVAPRAHHRLADACVAFLEAKRREKLQANSIRSYTSSIRILEAWATTRQMVRQPVSAFSTLHARDFMAQSAIERALSDRAYNNYHTFFTTLWRWFVDMGYAPSNVFEPIKKRRIDPDDKQRRPPTKEERDMIRKHLAHYHRRFLAFCLLVFHSGIRPKEAFMLKPEHFHLREQFIDIPRSISKVKRPRHAALARVDIALLRELKIHEQDATHYIFSTGFMPGPILKDSRYSGLHWQILRRETGLPKEVTLYQLKHAGGQQLSEDGMAPVELMNHFGHRDLKITAIYTRASLKRGSSFVRNKATPL